MFDIYEWNELKARTKRFAIRTMNVYRALLRRGH